MKRVVIAALALCAAACATPYQEIGLMGGVDAAAMGGDVYRIEAHLNAYSSPSMVLDYVMLRASETAQQQGAAGFVILTSADASRGGAFVTPGAAITTGSAAAYGNAAYGSAVTTYTPAMMHRFVKPGGIVMIKLVRDPGPTDQYINASETIAAIGPRVRRH
jgi:hypothetical protein